MDSETSFVDNESDTHTQQNSILCRRKGHVTRTSLNPERGRHLVPSCPDARARPGHRAEQFDYTAAAVVADSKGTVDELWCRINICIMNA